MDKQTIEFYNINARKYADWRSAEGIDIAQKIFLNEINSDGKMIDEGCQKAEL